MQLLELDKKEEAISKCKAIANTCEDDHKILNLCANIAVQCGWHEGAVKWLQKAVLLEDQKADYHYSLGMVYMKMRSSNAAIASFKKVLKVDANHIDAQLKLGLAYCHSGAYQKAVTTFQQVIKADPNRADPFCWLGIAYHKLSLSQKAEDCFLKSLEINPNYAEAYFQLGLLYLNRSQLVPSRDCFYKVISLDRRNCQALGNLCMVLRDLGELNEARRMGHWAAKLNPDRFEVWHNLGNVHKDLGTFDEASAYYGKAIQINPESALTHVGMGIALHRKGEDEKAVHSFERALSYNPSEGTAISNLYNISMMNCDWEKADYYKQRIHNATIKSLRMNQVPTETPFLNLVRCDDPKMNYAVARAWSRDIDNRMSGIRKSLRFQYAGNTEGKIRIGYLSNNFGDHPTAHITRRLYGLHDRSRFEIFCYSYGDDDNSRYRKAIQAGCDAFVDIRNLSCTQAAKRVNDDGINILVDLVGYMRGGRIAIAALRPAPIQVRWLGMAGTTGADFFDYLITDKIVTSENQSRFYSENFVYLPSCYQINDNQPFVAKNSICRSDVGLPEDAFVFCCFNTSYKVDSTIFSAWMNILKRSQNSVLWLMADSSRLMKNLTAAAKKNGIDANRLIFAKKVPKDEHLERLNLADIALDTCLVNGAASTSDALLAGVPVLTIKGNHFASRMSSSILKAIGLENMVEKNLKDYQNFCIKIVKEKKILGKIKKNIKTNIKVNSLFKTEQFVKHLELAYEDMWSILIKDENKVTINIEDINMKQ